MKNFLENFLPVGNGNKVTAFSGGQKALNGAAGPGSGQFCLDKLSGLVPMLTISLVKPSRCSKNRAAPFQVNSGC